MNRPAEFGDREFYTEEEVKAISDRAANSLANGDKALDPDRAAPEAGANVGAYDGFWMNFGDSASAINGKYRTSIITYPENGRRPGLTEEGKETEAGAILRQCLGGGIQASMPTIQMSASEGVAKSIFLAITENQENEFYSSQGFLVSDPNPAQQMPVNG